MDMRLPNQLKDDIVSLYYIFLKHDNIGLEKNNNYMFCVNRAKLNVCITLLDHAMPFKYLALFALPKCQSFISPHPALTKLSLNKPAARATGDILASSESFSYLSSLSLPR